MHFFRKICEESMFLFMKNDVPSNSQLQYDYHSKQSTNQTHNSSCVDDFAIIMLGMQ